MDGGGGGRGRSLPCGAEKVGVLQKAQDEAGRIAEFEEDSEEGEPEANETELLGEFKEFIENIRPEDFDT